MAFFDRKKGHKSRRQHPSRQSGRRKSDLKKAEKNPDNRNDPDSPVRLNKYIANAGICSRREADQLIESGEISINGKTITTLGTKVRQGDVVKFNGQVLRNEKPVYLLLNKPKGYLTTTHDPDDRKTVMELVKGACRERIYPVGRLDRNTTGLLLFTNDGDLAKKLAHPSHRVKKIYEVGLDRAISQSDLAMIHRGIHLEDGFIQVDDIAVISPDKQKLGIEIHSGRNRVIRRIFEHFGYKVTKLDRSVYANLTKKDLPRGKWRILAQKEIVQLKHLRSGTVKKKQADS